MLPGAGAPRRKGTVRAEGILLLLSKACGSLSPLPLPRGLVVILSISLKFMLLELFTALTDLLLVLFFYNL